MPPELALYITKYGYLAVFSLVFLQEIGAPNPVPNEIVLLFSGYLAYAGILSFPLVFLSAVLGDVLGTTLLYFVFYFFGTAVVKKFSRWLPTEKIEKLQNKITKNGRVDIFVGRLIPYLRGYISVVAGLVRIPPRIFLSTVAFSAILWSGGYVTIGRIFGKQYDRAVAYLGGGTSVLFLGLGFLILFWLIKRARKKKTTVSVL